MPSFDIVRTWEAPEFFRVQSVIGSFALLDCKLEKRFKGSLPIDEEPWQIGVIVGRSGTGKTSIEYESDWINITDKCGQNIVITHNLNSTDLIVDIQGKTTLDSGPHQRNYGLTGHMQGWSRTYGGTSYDDAYALVQTTDGGYSVAGYTESFGAGNADFWLVKVGVEAGLAWIDSSANTITLYRGATDTSWNYVRVRLWKPR